MTGKKTEQSDEFGGIWWSIPPCTSALKSFLVLRMKLQEYDYSAPSVEASCPAGLRKRHVGGVTADLVQQNQGFYGATPFVKASDKGLPEFFC